MTYMARPQHKNPYPGVMKFTISVDLSLVSITIHLVCMHHTPEQRRKLFKKYIKFTLFTQKLPSLRVKGHEPKRLLLLLYKCHHSNCLHGSFQTTEKPTEKSTFLNIGLIIYCVILLNLPSDFPQNRANNYHKTKLSYELR